MLITRLHFRQGMRRIHASPRKSFSTFAFTLSSILISVGLRSPRASAPQGDQGRLKPSPGNFFVASTPSLLPMVPQARDSWRGRARRPGSVINSASFPSFQICRNQAILSSCPSLIGLDAAWRGAAALPKRHHSQCGEAFMNRRHPDFRMPPLGLVLRSTRLCRATA